MTQAHLHCRTPEQIHVFLRGGLTSLEEESLQRHLDECVACRELLSQSAADDAVWREAREFFSGEANHEAAVESFDATSGNGDEPESIESLLKLLGPTDDPRMLGRIGPYEIVGVLGRGGMGIVFKAYEPSLNRYVAIKLLLPHLAASGAARMRFAREGRAAAAVIDDNVLPIFSVAEWQGVPYLVTQLSRGSNLQKRINESGPLELQEILRLGMQTASGLAAAHAQGLVHRDVKPSNILLDGTVERALLTDFGLARAVDDASITCSGMIAGTPQYMSPEQARGGVVDARSDLFGLGSVLYTMCTGRPPFRAENSFAVLRLITDMHPRPIREINSDIPDWLCTIIGRLMSKRPEDRYHSASKVAELLSACLAHVRQPTTVNLPRGLGKTTESRRFAIGYRTTVQMLAAVVMGSALVAAVLFSTNASLVDAAKKGEVIGTLKNESGEPIRNATVACSAVYDKAGVGGGASAITDAEGRYRFPGLTEGVYSVWLKHYENPQFTAIVDDGIEVTAGKEARSALTLIKTNHVTGVLTVTGKPVTADTRILCYCRSRPESSATALTALADDQGRFVFDLPPGRVTFLAMGRHFPFAVKEQQSGVESPNHVRIEFTPRPSRFGSTEWLARSTEGTEVLEQNKADDITGTIVDTEGQPIQEAKAFTEAETRIVTSDKEGGFRYPLAKGTQTILRVFKPGYHIWFGTPTAGDRLKVVLEKKQANPGLTKTAESVRKTGGDQPTKGGVGTSEQKSPRRVPVSCMLVVLNKPGTVDVEVSVGLDDGIKPGDKLYGMQDGQIIGTVEITKAENSRSIARILEVVPGKAFARHQFAMNEMAKEIAARRVDPAKP